MSSFQLDQEVAQTFGQVILKLNMVSLDHKFQDYGELQNLRSESTFIVDQITIFGPDFLSLERSVMQSHHLIHDQFLGNLQ